MIPSALGVLAFFRCEPRNRERKESMNHPYGLLKLNND